MVFFADDGIRSSHKLVVAGLHPAIHEVFPQWKRIMDARVKPAHDT
jgi:hypothetical protein